MIGGILGGPETSHPNRTLHHDVTLQVRIIKQPVTDANAPLDVKLKQLGVFADTFEDVIEILACQGLFLDTRQA